MKTNKAFTILLVLFWPQPELFIQMSIGCSLARFSELLLQIFGSQDGFYSGKGDLTEEHLVKTKRNNLVYIVYIAW